MTFLLWIVAALADELPGDELTLSGVSVAGTVPGTRTTRVVLSATAANASCADFRGVTATLAGGLPRGVRVLDGTFSFGDVPPYGASASSDTVTLAVPNALVSRIAALAGSLSLSWEGTEEPVVAYDDLLQADVSGILGMSFSDVDGWSGSVEVLFDEGYTLECPDCVGMDTDFDAEVVLLELIGEGGAEYSPLRVTHATCGCGDYVYEFRTATVDEVYTCATVTGSTGWSDTVDGVDSDAWQQDGCDPAAATCAMADFDGLVVGFTDVELAPDVYTSGSLALGDVDAGLTLRVREGAVDTLTAHLDFASVVGGSIEADAAASASGETTVASVSLPPVSVPVGLFNIDLYPVIGMRALAEGELTAGARLGWMDGATHQVDVGWQDGGLVLDAASEGLDLPFDGPTWETALAAQASVAAAFDVELWVEHLAGPRATLAPTLSARTNGSDWALACTVEVEGAFQANLFGFQETLAEVGLASIPVCDLSGPLEEDGSTGAERRWLVTVDTDPSRTEPLRWVVPLSDGGTLALGGGGAGLLVRLDAAGELRWASRISGFVQEDDLVAAAEIPDGSGHVLLVTESGLDILNFVELDAEGVEVAHFAANPPDGNDSNDGELVLLHDATSGDWIVAADTPSEVMLTRFTWSADTGPTFSWTRTYEMTFPAGGADTGLDLDTLVLLADGDLLATGATEDETEGGGVVWRMDPDGEVAATFVFATVNNVVDFVDAVELDDGTVVVLGNRNTDTYYTQDAEMMVLLGLDAGLGYAWHTTLGIDEGMETLAYGTSASLYHAAFDTARALATDGSTLFAAGWSGYPDASGWITAVSPDGYPWWTTSLVGEDGEARVYDLASTDDGLAYVGTWRDPAVGWDEGMVGRLARDGGLRPDGGVAAYRSWATTQVMADDDGTLASLQDGWSAVTDAMVVSTSSTQGTATVYTWTYDDRTDETTITRRW